jgi:predicted RNase H-like HicB family nuclease
MLTKYIDAAMRRATYEILPDNTFWGEIAGFQGVYSNQGTLAECRDELQSVLEGWIILGLQFRDTFPEVDGLTIEVMEEQVAEAV